MPPQADREAQRLVQPVRPTFFHDAPRLYDRLSWTDLAEKKLGRITSVFE
jgi:hypothetical protein